jgi:hypothetical protein
MEDKEMIKQAEEAADEGARRATEAAAHNRQVRRFSCNKKTEIVLRWFRGEPLETLSREYSVGTDRISQWRDRFLEAGREAMKERSLDETQAEIERLQQKIGEITMNNELLEEKIIRMESARPLARGRLSR